MFIVCVISSKMFRSEIDKL